jgi:hypothetical protein
MFLKVFLKENPYSWLEVLRRFWEYFNVYLVGCPLLLRVTLRYLEFFYSYFIEWDFHMQIQKFIPTIVNDTLDLHKLAKVQHIFTSKNEILTDNFYIFKMCSIGDKIYGSEE